MTFQTRAVAQACVYVQLTMYYETKGQPKIQGQQKEFVLATQLEIKLVSS